MLSVVLWSKYSLVPLQNRGEGPIFPFNFTILPFRIQNSLLQEELRSDGHGYRGKGRGPHRVHLSEALDVAC